MSFNDPSISSEPLDDQTPRLQDLATVKCAHRGGTRLVEGWLLGRACVQFRAKRHRRFWMFRATVPRRGPTPASCAGAVTLVADPDEIRRLIRR